MPVSKLEYTSNIKLTADELSAFFKALHLSMVDVIGTDLASCKSSALMFEHYCIADNSTSGGFAILYIQILPGRTDEQKNKLKQMAGEQLINLLQTSKCDADVQVRVLVSTVDRALYVMEEYSAPTLIV